MQRLLLDDENPNFENPTFSQCFNRGVGSVYNKIKTKFLISGVGLNLLQDSGEFPCAICRSGGT